MGSTKLTIFYVYFSTFLFVFVFICFFCYFFAFLWVNWNKILKGSPELPSLCWLVCHFVRYLPAPSRPLPRSLIWIKLKKTRKYKKQQYFLKQSLFSFFLFYWLYLFYFIGIWLSKVYTFLLFSMFIKYIIIT